MPTLLTFTNTHTTMAASDALTDAGIPHRIIPRPAQLAAGCGIALEVEAEAVSAALDSLDNARRALAAVYDAENYGPVLWVPRPFAAWAKGQRNDG